MCVGPVTDAPLHVLTMRYPLLCLGHAVCVSGLPVGRPADSPHSRDKSKRVDHHEWVPRLLVVSYTRVQRFSLSLSLLLSLDCRLVWIIPILPNF